MKQLLSSAALIALGATSAHAGGIERAGQAFDILFEDGTYVELSFGLVNPSVSGTVAGGLLSSGDMADSYTQVSLGFKKQINDQISLGLIIDQPIGANVDYPAAAAPYPIAGSTAVVKSNAISVIGRYKFNDRFSVHGGLRAEKISGEASLPAVAGYTLDASSNYNLGYSIGAAYEIPDIALRVALTYNSEITHTMSSEEGGAIPSTADFDVVTPRSVNLDFQSGVAADTLVFGSVRWVKWSEFEINPGSYATLTGEPLVSYDEDTVSYTLGIGRKFSDTFSGSIAVGYEAGTGDPVSNLGPTDGYFNIQVGGAYTVDNIKLSAGIRYVMIGDAETSAPISGDFSGNHAIALGVKVGYTF